LGSYNRSFHLCTLPVIFGHLLNLLMQKTSTILAREAGCDTLTSSPMFTRIPPIMYFSHSIHPDHNVLKSGGNLRTIPILEAELPGTLPRRGCTRKRHGKCMPEGQGNPKILLRSHPPLGSQEKEVFPFVVFPYLLNFYHSNNNRMNLSCGVLFPP
jgi:hypothetical protein